MNEKWVADEIIALKKQGTKDQHALTHNIGGTDAIATASASSNGLLSSTDWTTFNQKQNAMSAKGISSTYTDAGYYATPGTIYNYLNSYYQKLQSDYFLSIIPPNASLVKSNMDSSGVYLTYTWTIAKITGANQKAGKWVSTLSSDYTRRTLTVYDINQSNVIYTCTFNRTLDSYGNLVSEVVA